MGQSQVISKPSTQWIRPLPGWYGTNIHAKGKVAVYCESLHAIYSVSYSSSMTVKELKVGICRVMHRPPTLSLRLCMGDQQLADGDSLEMLTPESLLRVEILSDDSTSDTFVSDCNESRRVVESVTKPPKSLSVDTGKEQYFNQAILRTDFSELEVEDLQLTASRAKRKKQACK